METRAGVSHRGDLGGPAELVLLASVARRYYVDTRTKVEIADEFGLSRFKVARLLETARDVGLVRIEIGWPGDIDVHLSGLLRERLDLVHAIVVDTPETEAVQLRRALGGPAARLLEEVLSEDDVLGLSWARSVHDMTAALTRLPAAPVVQLTGALSRPDMEVSAMELVRGIAQLSGGRAYLYYAPLVVPDAATARALRNQPEVARAFAQYRSVTKAVAGIGLWGPGHSTVYEAAGTRERRALLKQGVVADVSGILLDAEGSPVETPLSDRMVGISAAQMRAIPEVIGIAYDEVKAPAVLAAVRGGLVNALVTHSSLARAILEGPDSR